MIRARMRRRAGRRHRRARSWPPAGSTPPGRLARQATVPTPTAADGDAEAWFAALAGVVARGRGRATRSRAAWAAADRWRRAASRSRR